LTVQNRAELLSLFDLTRRQVIPPRRTSVSSPA
jgi:hypothetical protein